MCREPDRGGRRARPATAPARSVVTLAVVSFLLILAGCGHGSTEERAADASLSAEKAASVAALVGREPVPRMHRAENNSDTLVQWLRAGVRDRIVVHLDGHVDWDWLPDRAVEAILAAKEEKALRTLEAHPYDLDAPAHGRFGIWNYIYPAWRAGVVRELVWVVPDGTLTTPRGFEPLRRRLLADHLQGVTAEEVLGFTFDGRVASGRLLGMPVRVVEIDHLPPLTEPVLLDLDVDYFGTADAVSLSLTLLPARGVAEVMERFAGVGLRADLATVCTSNVGGYLPVMSRGMADEVALWLADPDEARRREEKIGTLLRDAREALVRGEARQAVAHLAEVRIEQPGEAGTSFLLSSALRAIGDEAGAGRLLDEALAADPAYADADLFRADSLYLQGQADRALDLYRGLLQAPGHRWSGYLQRRVGNCLYRQGHLDEAEVAFRKVLEAHPGHADTWADLALCALNTGRTEEGIGHLTQALTHDPHNGEHARKLAAVLVQQGRNAEALEAAVRAVRVRPGDPESRKAHAVALAAGGQPGPARREAALAVRLDPGNPDSLALLGALALRTGDPRAAAAAFQEALRLQPDHPMARSGLARARSVLPPS